MNRTPLLASVLFALSPAALAGPSDCPPPSTESDCEDAGYQPIVGQDARGINNITRHGVRMGYSWVNLQDNPLGLDPNMFVMGYEVNQTFDGGGAIDFLITANVMVSGINQSLFVPNANLLTGLEIGQRVQVGAGPNLSVSDPSGNDRLLHMIMAIGYTPAVGDLSIPVHLSYIPDVDGYFRVAATTGVNW